MSVSIQPTKKDNIINDNSDSNDSDNNIKNFMNVNSIFNFLNTKRTNAIKSKQLYINMKTKQKITKNEYNMRVKEGKRRYKELIEKTKNRSVEKKEKLKKLLKDNEHKIKKLMSNSLKPNSYHYKLIRKYFISKTEKSYKNLEDLQKQLNSHTKNIAQIKSTQDNVRSRFAFITNKNLQQLFANEQRKEYRVKQSAAKLRRQIDILKKDIDIYTKFDLDKYFKLLHAKHKYYKHFIDKLLNKENKLIKRLYENLNEIDNLQLASHSNFNERKQKLKITFPKKGKRTSTRV